MKHLLITTIAAVVLVGCATTQSPELTVGDIISIQDAVGNGNIEAVKQHIAAGVNVNAKVGNGSTALNFAAYNGHKEMVELLINNGADVNVVDEDGEAPLDFTVNKEIISLLRKHGGKTAEELKAGCE